MLPFDKTEIFTKQIPAIMSLGIKHAWHYLFQFDRLCLNDLTRIAFDKLC